MNNSVLNLDLNVAKVLADLVFAESLFQTVHGSSNGEGTRRECISSWGWCSRSAADEHKLLV